MKVYGLEFVCIECGDENLTVKDNEKFLCSNGHLSGAAELKKVEIKEKE